MGTLKVAYQHRWRLCKVTFNMCTIYAANLWLSMSQHCFLLWTWWPLALSTMSWAAQPSKYHDTIHSNCLRSWIILGSCHLILQQFVKMLLKITMTMTVVMIVNMRSIEDHTASRERSKKRSTHIPIRHTQWGEEVIHSNTLTSNPGNNSCVYTAS